MERIPKSLPFQRTLRFANRNLGDRGGKTNPQVGFHKRAWRARGVLRPAGRAFNKFLLIPALAGINGGFRRLALILSAHGAGMRIVTYGPNGRLRALP